MAALVGCGVFAGIVYYKRMSILKTFLTTYSDYKESQKEQQDTIEKEMYEQTPKEKLISCKYFELNPDDFKYERTTDRKVTASKICKLKFKNMVFYSFMKNYNLRDTYLEYIDNIDTENSDVITHLNKITNRTAQLLSATATIKIKSHNVDYIPEFDIIDLLNNFSFNGNRLYLTEANKVFMVAVFNMVCDMNISLDNFFLDKNTKNLNTDNLDITIEYQLITNNADIYTGANMVLTFDEYNNLTVATKFKDL